MTKNINFDTVLERIDQYSKVPLHISDIVYDDRKFCTDQYTINGRAIRHLANICSIKDSLIGDISDNEGQWSPLRRALTTIKSDRIVTGVVDRRSNNIVQIQDRQITEETPLKLHKGVELIQHYLTDHKSVELHEIRFNEENLRVEADIRDQSGDIDVFNDNKDIWSSGVSFHYMDKHIMVAPFLLRLICTNGMSVSEMIERRFLQKGASEKTVQGLIAKTLTRTVPQHIQLGCNRLRRNTASVAEFEDLRNTMVEVDKNLLDVYASEDVSIKNAYAKLSIDISSQKKEWKKNANTNINAYDLFNRATHCSSHAEGITDNARLALNRLAGKMLMSGPDRADVNVPDPFLN